MLSPDARQVAIEILRPPSGYRFDHTVMTTYTLDLEVLLALPLAVLAQTDRGVEELLDEPLRLLQSLREAADRVQVFVDEAGIAVPGQTRELYAALESSVHPVRAPGGGAFHPKVWVARFTAGDQPPLLRVAIASRNLTHDRSWDVALVSEAEAGQGGDGDSASGLARLIGALPALGRSADAVPGRIRRTLERLAAELAATAFPAPAGFEGAVRFHALGLDGPTRQPWQPMERARRLLAIAPFVNAGGLETLLQAGPRETQLVSRAEALDALPAEGLARWGEVQVLMDGAVDEAEDDDAAARRPSGLHAKLIAMEHGFHAHWFVGSANLTRAAFGGRNVEMMAEIVGRKGREGSERGVRIERFLESGFAGLCVPYPIREPSEEDQGVAAARRALEAARDAVLEAALSVRCAREEAGWAWSLQGHVPPCSDVAMTAWPVSLGEPYAQALDDGATWTMPLERLTAFVAVHLRVAADVDDLTLVVKLPTEGLPEGRMDRVLRIVINSPERFLQFLRALLGGLERLVDWAEDGPGRGGEWTDRLPLEAETLLEDLLRVAAREPERLETVRQLMADLSRQEDGTRIVPEDFHAIWQAVDAAIREGRP
ncbi:phospholipase D family protein [Arhodomonas sp. SL1]|uniref:phospholipase D family protein n=1 Tax=Arhodomonas sp. SL1 TaxID=3425691 RepID=UPI003F882F17